MTAAPTPATPRQYARPHFRYRVDGRPQPARLKMPTLGAFLNEDIPIPRFLLNPWLRAESASLVYAPSGVGKSFFTHACALAVAGGGSFLGWECAFPEGVKTLLVDGEMHAADVQSRLSRMLAGASAKGLKVDPEKAKRNLLILARQHQQESVFPSITDPEGVRNILDNLTHHEIGLVVLDNFSTLGEVEDENAASSFNQITQTLLALKTEGVAVLLVHHARKDGGSFRGSSKLAATFESILALDGESERVDGELRLELSFNWEKNRSGEKPDDITAVMEVESQFGVAPKDAPLKWAVAGLSKQQEQVLEGLREGRWGSYKAVAEELAVSAPRVTKIVNALVEKRFISRKEIAGIMQQSRRGEDGSFKSRRSVTGRGEGSEF